MENESKRISILLWNDITQLFFSQASRYRFVELIRYHYSFDSNRPTTNELTLQLYRFIKFLWLVYEQTSVEIESKHFLSTSPFKAVVFKIDSLLKHRSDSDPCYICRYLLLSTPDFHSLSMCAYASSHVRLGSAFSWVSSADLYNIWFDLMRHYTFTLVQAIAYC